MPHSGKALSRFAGWNVIAIAVQKQGRMDSRVDEPWSS